MKEDFLPPYPHLSRTLKNWGFFYFFALCVRVRTHFWYILCSTLIVCFVVINNTDAQCAPLLFIVEHSKFALSSVGVGAHDDPNIINLIFARKSTEIIHFSLFNIHYSLNPVRVILSVVEIRAKRGSNEQ